MGFEIYPFAPLDATDQDYADLHRLTLAAIAVDRPDTPRPTLSEVIAEIRTPPTGPGPNLFWTAQDGGTLLALAEAHLPEAENRHIAATRITVNPAFRHQGIGTAMLATIVPQLRHLERSLVACHGLTADSDAESWATGLGFRIVHRRVLQRLMVTQTNPTLWEVDVPPGYHIELWQRSAPDHLVDSFACARGAIYDSPEGDSSYQLPEWDVRKVREEEQDWVEHGFEYFVAAACTESGEVVGLTEVVLHPSRHIEALQQYTAVLPNYRGLALGRFVKAAMMRWLVANRPELASISTGTGSDNVHMIRINHQLGYDTVRSVITVEAKLGMLAERLRS